MTDISSPYRIPDPPSPLPLDALADRKASLALLGYSALAFAATVLVAALVPPLVILVGFPGFGVASVLALVGVVRGLRGIVRTVRAREPGRTTRPAMSALAALVVGNGMMAMLGALAALVSTMTFTRGRQLRRRGRVLLAPVRTGSAWATESERIWVEPQLRDALAARWRENGRTEHASVAAFARLTLDLIALGAQPALVASANRDALDEIRHTELCFSLARAIDGRSESPGAFPEAQRARTLPRARPLALAALAVDSLIDGALHEGVSARIVARLARRCEEPTIAAALREIAADEGRHAAHGWDVVRWCLAEGGSPVASALRGAARVLPERMASDLPAAARWGAWERYGIHGQALESEEHAKTLADLVRRVEALVFDPPAAA
jgi:hypothetical protein